MFEFLAQYPILSGVSSKQTESKIEEEMKINGRFLDLIL